MKNKGILLPVFSLPSPYGIGDFGKTAYDFVDFLSESGQRYWQILPLNQTSFGDSPYQSPSAYAGNPYFIDLEALASEGLLTQEELVSQATPLGPVDYAELYARRDEILRKAFSRFDVSDKSFVVFCESAPWLEEYIAFMAIKNRNGGTEWRLWKKIQQDPRTAFAPQEEKQFLAFVQFAFYKQWKALKAYANRCGVRIIGDIPIYVSADSVDVWAHPEYFQLDENRRPISIAGVPPDGFTPDGQMWGNPLYDWEKMREDNFRWWTERLRFAFETYDVIRIDHFRGFAAYYSIPYGDKTARNGKWVDAPGKELFAKVKEVFPDAPILAEDLGYLDNRVRELLAFTGYPGMKILQFAFEDVDSEYLPERYPENCFAYTGTHDNMTARQYLESVKGDERKRVLGCIRTKSSETRTHAFVRCVLESRADTVVIPMQDYLEIGKEGRVNTPSTLGGNWRWRLPENYRAEFFKKRK